MVELGPYLSRFRVRPVHPYFTPLRCFAPGGLYAGQNVLISNLIVANVLLGPTAAARGFVRSG